MTLATEALDLHLWRLAGGMMVCVFVSIAAAIAIKRRVAAKLSLGPLRRLLVDANQRLTILETRRLSVHADACRFVCDGKEYLVVVSQGGATLLGEREQRTDLAR